MNVRTWAVLAAGVMVTGCNCDGSLVPDAGGVVGALDHARWELPCHTGTASGDGCAAGPAVHSVITLGGDPAQLYDLTVRFRGVVEYFTLDGGTGIGPVREGGAPVNVGLNIYSLAVADPAATWYLNAGGGGPRRCFGLDEQAVVTARGGTTLTLAGDPLDGAELRNRDDAGVPIVVPGVPPAPLAFDGQFIQADVLEVRYHP